MAKQEQQRIAILGAGPIGLEAALYARKLDHPVALYERGRIAEYMQRWGHVKLFSPFGMNYTPLGRAAILAEKRDHEFPADGDYITGREHVRKYLEPLAASAILKPVIINEMQVLRIGRQTMLKHEALGDAKRGKKPFRILLRDSKGKERVDEADIVLDCTGTYGQHRWLGDGGIPALGELAAETQIGYHLDDIQGDRQAQYTGRTVLVVGAGYSAATSVCNLADLLAKSPDTLVYWAVRGSGSQPVRRFANDPLRERDRLAGRANSLATRTDGNVICHPGTTIEAIETFGPDKGFRVTARKAGQALTWQVDKIVANLGYIPDTIMYRELQIAEHPGSQGPLKLATALMSQRTDDCLKQSSCGADTLLNPEPNFFILGAKSFGRNGQFLLRVGFEQIREVFRLIAGKSNLDLYKASR